MKVVSTEVKQTHRIRFGLITALLVLSLSIPVVFGTLAYLSDKGPMKRNRFTFGNVDIRVTETFRPPSSLKVGDNTYQKQVVLKNTGTVSAYARLYLSFSNHDIEDISKVSSDGGTTWYSLSDFRNHLPSGWAYQASGTLGGYFYYTKPLAPGQSTTALFTHVKTTFQQKTADTNRTINYTPRDYDIYVYAEGVQQMKLNGSSNHSDYKTAWSEFLNLKN